MVMVASVEVLVFFNLTVFSTVIVPFRPTVSIFCFFNKVGDTKRELLFPEEVSDLGVSGGGVIKEEEDGSVSTLMVIGCNGRFGDNLGATIVHLWHLEFACSTGQVKNFSSFSDANCASDVGEYIPNYLDVSSLLNAWR